MRFVELVMAVVALIGRMRDINSELTKRVAHLTRKRPRSETLERLERQLVLPLRQVWLRSMRKAGEDDSDPTAIARSAATAAAAAVRSPLTSRASTCPIPSRQTAASARSAARR